MSDASANVEKKENVTPEQVVPEDKESVMKKKVFNPSSSVKGPFPKTLAATSGKTPYEVLEEVDNAHKAKVREEQEKLEAKKKGSISGFFTDIGKSINKAVNDVTAPQTGSRNRLKAAQLLSDNFPDFAQLIDKDGGVVKSGEEAFCSYGCRAITADGTPEAGHIVVSTKHVAFISKEYRLAVSLADVVSIRPSVALPKKEHKTHVILPPDADVIVDSLSIFMKNGDVYDFAEVKAPSVYSVKKFGEPVEQFLVFFDRFWRAEATIPAEGVTYAESLY